MITVLIADDHDIVREGLRQIVSETQDITVGGEARTGGEAIEQARAGTYDVIILDGCCCMLRISTGVSGAMERI